MNLENTKTSKKKNTEHINLNYQNKNKLIMIIASILAFSSVCILMTFLIKSDQSSNTSSISNSNSQSQNVYVGSSMLNSNVNSTSDKTHSSYWSIKNNRAYNIESGAEIKHGKYCILDTTTKCLRILNHSDHDNRYVVAVQVLNDVCPAALEELGFQNTELKDAGVNSKPFNLFVEISKQIIEYHHKGKFQNKSLSSEFIDDPQKVGMLKKEKLTGYSFDVSGIFVSTIISNFISFRNLFFDMNSLKQIQTIISSKEAFDWYDNSRRLNLSFMNLSYSNLENLRDLVTQSKNTYKHTIYHCLGEKGNSHFMYCCNDTVLDGPLLFKPA